MKPRKKKSFNSLPSGKVFARQGGWDEIPNGFFCFNSLPSGKVFASVEGNHGFDVTDVLFQFPSKRESVCKTAEAAQAVAVAEFQFPSKRESVCKTLPIRRSA